MPVPATIDVCKVDLFLSKDQLEAKYDSTTAARVMRIRDMYNYKLAYPSATDRAFVDEVMGRYGIGQSQAYSDLSVIKQLLPMINSATKAYHRWRANEMALETYKTAKLRKDTKTMAAITKTYAEMNRVNLEDETAVPYDDIVVQPFTATSDPTVLGIKPIPNIQKRIKEMIAKYTAETIDIEDVEAEEADLEEDILFPETVTMRNERDILQ